MSYIDYHYFPLDSGHELRAYTPGEDLSGIGVHPKDEPKEGGFIARLPLNHSYEWYVSPENFRAFYKPTIRYLISP